MEKEMNQAPFRKLEGYSIYAEKNKEEMARIKMLEAQIEALRKSIEGQEASGRPGSVARIQEEIAVLKKELADACRRVGDNDADERSVNKFLANTGPDDMPHA